MNEIKNKRDETIWVETKQWNTGGSLIKAYKRMIILYARMELKQMG